MELNLGQSCGHYKILSLIGIGGMGEVYLAEDIDLHRQVALKFLPLELTDHPDRLKRFEQEARAVSALNHPNILTIHEFGSRIAWLFHLPAQAPWASRRVCVQLLRKSVAHKFSHASSSLYFLLLAKPDIFVGRRFYWVVAPSC